MSKWTREGEESVVGVDWCGGRKFLSLHVVFKEVIIN